MARLALEAQSRTRARGERHHQAIGVLVLRICIIFCSVVASRVKEAQIPLINHGIVSHVDISKVSIHPSTVVGLRVLLEDGLRDVVLE